MEKLNVCQAWVNCHGRRAGNCGRRRPSYQGTKDLFWYNICRRNLRNQCPWDASTCSHRRTAPDWLREMTAAVGPADAMWDWTTGPLPTPKDDLVDLLRGSPSVNSEKVLDGILQLVRGDRELVAYFEEVRDRVR